jgi:hypothetical protein
LSRNRCVKIAVNHSAIDVVLVISAVAGERGQRRNNLAWVCVHADMQLSPGSAYLHAALLDQPHSPAPRNFNPVLSTSR